MKLFKTFPVSLLFIFVLKSNAQDFLKPGGEKLKISTIDSLVTLGMDSSKVSGLCIGLLNNNLPFSIRSYGYRDKEKNLPNDTATCFYAASLTKTVFAYIVMQLVDKKVIDLDKPLYTYLPKPIPEYDKYKDLAGDERWKLITARHCLDHTTGFPNFRWFNPHDNQKLEFFFTPGTRYAYSGEGLELLQMVVETITGQSLESLAEENIFTPFAMYRTSFIWQNDFESDYAFGYDEKGNALKKKRRTKADAAGSMETTIADYTRFISAVMQGKGISEKSKREMFTPQIKIFSQQQFPSLNETKTDKNQNIQLSYGLGWGLFVTPYGKAFFKEGHDDGWGHYMICIPEKNTALILMSNSSNGEKIFTRLVEKIMGVMIPWEWEGYTP